MFEHFFGKLGIQQQTQPSNATSEAGKWRQQILALGEYLGGVRLGSGSRKRIVESVRLVSEAAVWSDRRSPELLSVIIDCGLPKALLRLLREQQQRTEIKREKATAVTVQILQTLSIILDGVSDTHFLQALLGDGFVNDLIGAPVDLDCEEVLAYYVAFLKALSLKLTSSTIHYFFINQPECPKFPLFTTAIALFDHPDSMVRVAVRAITLNVIRINDPDALEFLLGAPACAHFWGQVMHAIKDCCDDAFRLLVDMPQDGSASWAAVDQVLENHMGLLAYVNDVCALGVDRINRRIALEFNDRLLTRTYIHAIEVGWRANATPEETLYMQVVTLCLAHFFAIVRYSPLLVDTVAALFTAQEEQQQQQQNHSVDSEDDAGSANSPRAYQHRPYRPAQSPAIQSPQSNHNPFIPSPFEPSRTLMPWLCVALEVLDNKAISPTVLVKSVLTPRRMLRTRALLESLTGGAALAPDDWRSDSAQSTLSSQTPHSLAGELTTANLLLPPLTRTIVTAMVHILADSPPSHTWPTVCLAGHVLAQLSRSSRGHIVLDPSLAEELVSAQRQHSAELRAMLLSVDELTESDATDSDHSSNSSSASTSTTPAVISWKVLVKCLFDFANSSADALRNKIQSESRHTFALPPNIKPTLPSISALSPFDSGGAPQDAVLAANLHQAHCLKRLVAASPNSAIDTHSTTAVQAKGLYSADLHSWLGAHTGATIVERGKELLWRSTTIIDNTTKHALPKKAMRLGFPASVTCLDGILVIRQAAATNGAGDIIELIWPMADLVVTRVLDEPSDAGHLPTLRLTDTIFPPLFFSPLPQSMGGIPALSPFALSPPLMPVSTSPTKRLHYAYLSPHRSLDISLRFRDAMECADVLGMLQRHIVVSRKALADIYLKHNVI
ncbi:Protein CL16A [Coemansia sp. RSA 922]|nr:Protein CL16A [Coemansia sp. S3946]KAJ2105337.1 Protein CL16A [Coemansia sp. RSA 922]